MPKQKNSVSLSTEESDSGVRADHQPSSSPTSSSQESGAAAPADEQKSFLRRFGVVFFVEIFGTLAPLALVIAFAVVLLTTAVTIADQAQKNKVIDSTVQVDFAVREFFSQQLDYYEFIRRQVVTGTLDNSTMYDDAAVATNGSITNSKGYDFYRELLYGPFTLVPNRIAMYQTFVSGETWKIHTETPGAYAFQVRAQTPWSRRFENRFMVAQGLRSATWYPYSNSTYSAFTRTWYIAGNTTRADPTTDAWNWRDAGDAIGQYVRFDGPETQSELASGNTDLPAMSMVFRADWPNVPGLWSVFRVKFYIESLSSVLSQITGRIGGERSRLFVVKISDGTLVARSDGLSIIKAGTTFFKINEIENFEDIELEQLADLDLRETDLPAATAPSFGIWFHSISGISNDWMVVIGLDMTEFATETHAESLELLRGLSIAVLVIIAIRVVVSALFFYRGVQQISKLEDAQRATQEGKSLAEAEARRAQEANEAKTRFVSVMSHEIRNPLAVVMLNGEMIEERVAARSGKKEDKELLKYCQGLSSSSKLLLSIVNHVMDLTKIESGNLQLESTKAKLLDIADGVIGANIHSAVAKGIDLSLFVHPACASAFTADPLRIHQILHNLVSNAIKFTSSGGIVLSVEPAKSSPTKKGKPQKLNFSVKDTGAGISEKDQKKLFLEFSQVDRSTTRKHGGAGLGLFICRQLAELMEGTITVSSKENEGSTFTFTVALTVADPVPVFDQFKNGSDPRLARLSCAVAMESKDSAFALAKTVDAMLGRTDSALHFSTPSALLRYVKDLDSKKKRKGARELIFIDTSLITESVLQVVAEHARHVCFVKILSEAPSIAEANGAAQSGWSYVTARPVKVAMIDEILGDMSEPDFDVDDDRALSRTSSASVTTNGSGWTRTRGMTSTSRTSAGSTATASSSDHDDDDAQCVMLVDDFATMRDLVEIILQRLGYKVILASNGAEAVEHFKSGRKISLIFMDCEMPIMDGYEATRRIRKLEKKQHLPRTPIVAATANAMADDRTKCLDCGMDDVMTKPIRKDNVKLVLKKFLARTMSIADMNSVSPLNTPAGKVAAKADSGKNDVEMQPVFGKVAPSGGDDDSSSESATETSATSDSS